MNYEQQLKQCTVAMLEHIAEQLQAYQKKIEYAELTSRELSSVDAYVQAINLLLVNAHRDIDETV